MVIGGGWSVAAGILLLLVSAPALAQQPAIGIQGIRGWLTANGQGNFESIEPEGRASQRIENLAFDERIGLSARGFFYDPALVEFNVGGQLGLTQEESSSDGFDQSGDGDLYGYDARLRFLRERPYTLDLFALRDTTTLSRDFAGTSRITIESFGATGYLRNVPIPLTVDVRQEEVDQRFSLAPPLSRLNERRSIARLTGTREWERHDIDLLYEFNRREDLVIGAADFDLHEGSIRHGLRFGADLQHRLLSSAQYRDSSGSFDTRSIQAAESLHMIHAQGLSSDLSYQFTDQDFSGGTTRTHAGSGSLIHQFYESLTTTLGAGGSTSDVTDGSISSYGPFLELLYRKSIPWEGIFGLGTGVSYRLQDQSVPGGFLSVFEERHEFSDGAPVLLTRPGVDPASIVVTDVTATTIYDEGPDYFVRRAGDQTTLERNPLGRILAGQPVLVSYTFAVPPDLEYSELGSHYDLTLDFPWVGVFYSHAEVDAHLIEGLNIGNFVEDIREDRVGFELRTPGGGPVTASLHQEYEDYRSERLTYTAFVLNQLVSYAASRKLTLSLSGAQSFFEFTDPDRTTDNYLARVMATWRPWRSVQFEGFGGVRVQTDSLTIDTRFIEGGLRNRIRFGQFDLSFSYTHLVRSVGTTDSTGDSFHFSVTRWIGW